MKHRGLKFLSLLLTLVMVLGMLPGMSLTANAAGSTNVTIDMTQQGYSNRQEVASVSSTDSKVTVVFAKAAGADNPKYYNDGDAVRLYNRNTMTVSASDPITSITITFGSGDPDRVISANTGSFNGSVWTGSANAVTFTVSGFSGHRRIQKLDVVLASSTVAVTGVRLNPGSASSKVGDTLTLTASVEPNNATDKKVKWSVGGDNPGALALYSDANCTAPLGTDATETLTAYAKCVSAGSATVTVTSNADSTKTASCDVTVQVTEPIITGAELVLEGTPKLRFHVTTPDGLDYSSSHMAFTIHNRTADIPIAKAGTAAGNERTFDCPVYSIEMAEPVTAVFHYKENDEAKTATLTSPVSVKDYLDLADTQYQSDTKLHALTNAARDYGHYIQLYLAELHGFTVGTDDETYTYDYQTMPNATEITALTGLDGYKTVWNSHTGVLQAVGYYDTFNETTTLNILFRVADGTSDITATVGDDPNKVDVAVESEDENHVAFGANTYRIRIPDIAANNLDYAYHVQLSADGNTFCDMKVSALTYVSTMLANGSPTTNEAKALTALYNYNVAADGYNQ